MNNDLINELYSKIDNQEKIIVDLQKKNILYNICNTTCMYIDF